MERFARLAVAFPTTVLMAVLAILLLGYISLQQLGVDLFPDLSNPRLFIKVAAGEEPPEEMERRYVTPMEAAAARGRGVERVVSIVQTGRAQVTVQYGWAADMDEAYLDLQKAMADFGQRNDESTITVSQQDPNAVPVIVAAFYHPDSDDPDALRQTAESIIRNELIRLPGVAAVELVGARQMEVEILADALTLEAFGLTVETVAGAVQRANRNLAGGSITEMGRRYVIRGVGEFESVAEIEDVIVGYSKPDASVETRTPSDPNSGEPIRLHQVATVRQALAPATNLVRLDGRRCLGLEIYKEARSNTISSAASIREQLDLLRRTLPGYELIVIQDQSHFVEAAVQEVQGTGLAGVLLAVVVLFLFLRRVGVTLVVSLAIPVSVVATFNLMYFGDLTLNLMTLGGLALGAGMLVDNAIVVVESIFRRMEQGDSPAEAAARGTGDVGAAITSSTLTTIIVFLPIIYLHGAAGALFKEQAWTVAFSLVSSLFVALVVIPMLCSRLLTGTRPMASTIGHAPRYAALLAGLLHRRGFVVMAAIILVVGTAGLLPQVGSEFMPRTGNGDLSIELTLPEGTSIERSEGTVRGVEAFVKASFPGIVEHVYARVGPASAEASQERLADENTAVVQLLLSSDIQQVPAALVRRLGDELGDLPDVDSRFLLQETALEASLGRAAAPLIVEIRGRQLETLSELAQHVAARLKEMPGLKGVEMSMEDGRPQVDVVIERTLAAQFGLQVDAVASQLEQLLSGREAGQLGRRGEYSDIVIRRPPMALEELDGLLLESPDGRRVRLDQIAELRPKTAPRAIQRSEQTRIVTVSAHLNSDEPFDRIARDVGADLQTIALPPEYRLAVTGEEQMREEAFGNLRFALLLAVALVYMVMAAQFESLVHPFVILLTIPLAGVGAVALLWSLGMPLNVMSFIGLIMLAGIAVNDSIILVDRINQGRRAGMDLQDAIVEAGRARLRPIFMTSVTTLLALLPLAIGFGEGAALRAPMAVAVIGGLVTSTTLTLVVIPCVYHLFARVDRLSVTRLPETRLS